MQNELVITPPEKLSQLISEAVRKEFLQKPTETRQETNTVLTNRQAMKYLHVSRSTLQRWRQEGKLPYRKVKGKILYTKDDIDQLLEEALK